MSITNLAGSTMSIVAHIDDDLLFQNPDIVNAIKAGGGHTTVFMTAGDAGRNTSFMEDREAGAKAAYGEMTGHSDWIDETITLTNGTTEFVIRTSYLESQPEIRLYFLRLPDGNSRGSGYSVNDYESVEKLWDGTIDTITTKDGANTFTADDISGVLLALMETHQPDSILLQDLNSEHVGSDHSDHFYASQFAFESQQYYGTEHDLYSYIEYATARMPTNLSAEDNEATRDAFYAYVHGSGDISRNFDAHGDPILPGDYNRWPDRHYHNEDVDQLEGSKLWTSGFGNANDVWNNDRHIRTLGDIDGDGMADVVGFGQGGVTTARSDGEAFGSASLGLRDLGYAVGGWNKTVHERQVADVNGDGFDDLIGFGDAHTFVALSRGDGTFSRLAIWSTDYARNDGWVASRHERLMGDVDGDGRADIVAFGDSGTEVALSTGSGFAAGAVWINDFDYRHGWRIGVHERVLADVNGDGMDDIVGFGSSRVIVALSNGSGFNPIQFWSTEFASNSGWREDTSERVLADVNGDGMADIVAFGADGVQVSLSNGRGFGASQVWSDDFGNNDAWSQDQDTRTVADVNGDGMADIVVFGNDGTRVSLSDGSRFLDPYDGDAPFAKLEVVEDGGPVGSTELLVNGDLTSSVRAGTWTANGDVDGWTNDNGGIESWGQGFLGIQTPDNGTIVELDRNGGGNVDNLYQDVQTEAGQDLELSFSSMQRGDDTDHIEVYWRGELIAVVQPDSGDDWSTFAFTVTGSGGLDRIEFREVADENDGSGPLIDNIGLLDVGQDEMAATSMSAHYAPVEEDHSLISVEPDLSDDFIYIL
ncbi:FG-GAP repeat domain-containing protein [Paracoccus tegillarcae]|uniref:Uncharacterized protein n=1 Tax=Paracoccus tegillarcae TaxID=1529068 RepID=A0A2K9EFA8_9RHOB|nr:VCBS repeat-containing protein [Paracoccus tegillarcae]AUH33029.1 hypothetical protein CUV01_06145 [Paracoccus tegillarcae]